MPQELSSETLRILHDWVGNEDGHAGERTAAAIRRVIETVRPIALEIWMGKSRLTPRARPATELKDPALDALRSDAKLPSSPDATRLPCPWAA